MSGTRTLSNNGVGDGWACLVHALERSKWDRHTNLIRDLARLLDAGGDIGDQLRLLTVAGEVKQSRAAIIGQSRDKAVELKV